MKKRNEGRGSVQRTHKLQPSSINCRFQNHLLFEQVISPYRRRQRGVTIAPIMIIDSNPPPLLYRSFYHSIYIYIYIYGNKNVFHTTKTTFDSWSRIQRVLHLYHKYLYNTVNGDKAIFLLLLEKSLFFFFQSSPLLSRSKERKKLINFNSNFKRKRLIEFTIKAARYLIGE